MPFRLLGPRAPEYRILQDKLARTLVRLDETERLLDYPFGDEQPRDGRCAHRDLTRVQDPSIAQITRDCERLSANGGGGPEEALGSYRETPVV